MNKIIIVLVVGCVMVAEAMLFSSKFKDGCDPNPCQHKGTCKLTDPRNKNASTCTCTEDYHGKHCELKTGCAKKPCKHGAECKNNPLNRTDYSCKCASGYVGKNCDHKNACEGTKNPCKNGGKCVIDKVSGNQLCECKPGFAPPKSCEKRVCNITEFKMKSHTSKSAKLWVDKAIEPRLKEVDDLAKLCKVHLHIMKSFILHPDAAKAYTYDPRDKTSANFYIGQAIGVHIYDTKDKLLCNEVCMAKVPIPVSEAKCFIDGLYAIKWKWSILDAGVIHTDFHHQNTLKYNTQREAVQNGCKDKKF